jgi:hypothetical protein
MTNRFKGPVAIEQEASEILVLGAQIVRLAAEMLRLRGWGNEENIEALLRDQGLAFTHPAEDTQT